MIHNWGWPHSKILNFSLRREDLYVTLGTPTLRPCMRKTNSKYWALKTNGGYVQENHTSVGKWKHTLKGLKHRLTPPELSPKIPTRKGPRQYCWWAQRRHPWAPISNGQKKLHFHSSHNMLYTSSLLQDWERQLIYLTHRNTESSKIRRQRNTVQVKNKTSEKTLMKWKLAIYLIKSRK